MILLDTSVLSELVKPQPDPRVVSWTRRSAAALAVPTIAVAEMAFGIEKLVEAGRRDELLDALRRLVAEFADRLFDFNVNAAWAYGRILARAPCRTTDGATRRFDRCHCTGEWLRARHPQTEGLHVDRAGVGQSLAGRVSMPRCGRGICAQA